MKLVDAINQYWGIILFLAGLIFHALWTYFKVGLHSNQIKNLEENNNATNNSIASINNKISSIDSKLDILLTGYHKEK